MTEDMEPKPGAKHRTRRIPYRAKVVVRPQDGSEPFDGEIIDLSMGGAFVETIMAPKPGTICDVVIAMRPMQYIGQARTLWPRNVPDSDDRPVGMAIEWINQTPSQRKLLYRQVDDYLRGGGALLVGRPDLSEGSSPAFSATTPKTESPTFIDRRWLIIGGAVAAVVVIVMVLVLL